MSATMSAARIAKLKLVEKEPAALAARIPTLFPAVAAIDTKHAALGGEAGFLGAPKGAHAETPNKKGWYRHYAGGSVYWTAAVGAREVHGLIRDKWAAMGWENSLLGFPTSDELAGGGQGRFSTFEGGVIYWSPATGAHEVHGDILARYRALGADRSFLGYPTSDEMPTADGKGRLSNFQFGQIAWSAARGAATSATSYEPARNGGGLRPQGLGGGGAPEVRRRMVCAAHMDLTDDENWPDNDEHAGADKQNELVLTSDLPQDVLTMQKGCGGEMRVELTLTGQVKLSGDVLVQGKALLYEGTSETTSDLDGDLDFTVLVPRDGYVSRTVTVVNEDEGGDKGVITMTLSNFAA